MTPSALLRRRSAALLAAATLPGCGLLFGGVEVNVNVLDTRSQLEQQVKGTYEQLSDDVALIASVRGVDPSGRITPRPPVSRAKEEALRATQSRLFNRDDVERFLGEGCAGEARSGELAVRPCDATAADERYRAFVEALVAEENRDRLVLMRRVVATNADLTEAELDEVRRVFADLQRERARPGWWVESPDGSWSRKAGG